LKQKFVTNLVLIILLNLLIKPLWIFGIDRKVQIITGEEAFGMYGTLLSVSFLLNILLDLGLTNYNNRNISQNHQLLRKYFANIVALKMILGFVYAIVVFSVAAILGYDSERIYILAFLVLNQFLTSFTLYLRSNIAGMQMHTVNSLISVLDRALMIIFCAVLIWGGVTDSAFRIEWFVYAQTAAYVITTLICFAIVLWKSKFPRFRFDRLFFMVVLRQSFPYALLVLLMSAYTRIDMVMIDKLLGDAGVEQVGIYIHGFRLFDAAYQFALLFAVLLFPMFSKMISEKYSIVELTRLSSLLLFIPSIILAVSSMFYRVEIMELMGYPDFQESAPIYSMLMYAFLGMAATIIYGTLLTANGDLKILNITSAVAVLINVVLNFILIPRYQAYGAAISAVFAQLFVGLSQYFIASRRFRFGIDPRLIFKIIVFIGGVIGLGLGSLQVSATWWIRFLGMVTASMLLAMALNLIDLRAMIRLIVNGDEVAISSRSKRADN
jgi:O-antigen/teichoic acid export membrane protein